MFDDEDLKWLKSRGTEEELQEIVQHFRKLAEQGRLSDLGRILLAGENPALHAGVHRLTRYGAGAIVGVGAFRNVRLAKGAQRRFEENLQILMQPTIGAALMAAVSETRSPDLLVPSDVRNLLFRLLTK